MDERKKQLQYWLENKLNLPIDSFERASEDASFRRYFRITSRNESHIVMDAPPDKEPVAPFIKVANALLEQQVHVPEIIAKNVEQGFLLLEDLGTKTYLDYLPDNPDVLYFDALQSLLKIQTGTIEQSISHPLYDTSLLDMEMELFQQWYLAKHLSLTLTTSETNLWQQTKSYLISQCKQQPQVWTHRDYHSRNLMITDHNNPGVIDFQDMVVGPLTYDLVSLFKDCYIAWPRQQQLDWLQRYLELLQSSALPFDVDIQQLIQWYDFTGLQRHLKVLGIFCRLHYRDGKSQYLQDLALVQQYVQNTLNLYPQLHEFKLFFDKIMKLSDKTTP